MPEENRPSPEKELLKLIEKPSSRRSLQAAAIKYHSLSFFSIGALRGRIAFLKNRLSGYLRGGQTRQLDIRALNNFLKLCIVALGFYFIFDLSSSILNLRKGLRLGTSYGKAPAAEPGQIASLLKAASYYLEKVRERDIFSMNEEGTASGGKAGKDLSQKAIEATSHLKLVGIAWSDDPDVMIEDTKAKRTFFLKKGQMVDGEIKLQAVFKDKVILSYKGEEVELK